MIFEYRPNCKGYILDRYPSQGSSPDKYVVDQKQKKCRPAKGSRLKKELK
jgi:hypothetical protein